MNMNSTMLVVMSAPRLAGESMPNMANTAWNDSRTFMVGIN